MSSPEEPVEPSGFAPHLKELSQPLERVREGLRSWMRRRLDDPSLEVSALQTQSGAGVANETVVFEVRRTTGPAAGATEGYVARLATPDSLYLDFDLGIHYRMYAAMSAFPTVPTPGVVGYEEDPEVVGAPFFVMERVDGLIPADVPSWATEGFIVDAEPAERRGLWEKTIAAMVELHRLPAESFGFLRTGATGSGAGDCLDYWMRALRWAAPKSPVPLAAECGEWLIADQPEVTGLSWGDSRLPNVIYRSFEPVAILDWDLVSLAGPVTDLAWWILMDPAESRRLEGIGSHDELLDRWEDLAGRKAADLRWYMALGAYRLAAILAKLFSMMVAKGHMTPDAAEAGLATGHHVQWMARLLELRPPAGLTPLTIDFRLDR